MKANPSNQRGSTLWGVLLGFGMVMFVIGFAWPLLIDERQLLSEADAQEYVDAAVALHASTEDHDHSAGHDHAHHGNESARARFDSAFEKAERARFAKNWGGMLLLSLGAAMVVAGRLGLRAREQQGRD